MRLWPFAICFFILVNGIAFGMFAWDKWCAENRAPRVSEGNLLFVALMGGTVGAITAQQWFRHKTRKQPFKAMLYTIAIAQAVGLLYLGLNGTLLRALSWSTEDI